MIFCWSVVLLLPLLVESKDTHFDILIFTQHWPYTTCLDWTDRSTKNGCRKIEEATWSVHGLWPTQFGRIAPGFCNNSWKFDYSSVKMIRQELDVYWPDYEIRNEPNSLWTHEWEKHGTCAAQLPQLNTEEKYFQAGVDLAKQNPITKWFKENNIVPGGRYKKSLLYQTVLEHTQTRPHIDCEFIEGEQYIKEIKICFSKNLTRVHCDNIVGGSRNHNPTGSCKDDKEFIYPSARAPGSHLVLGLVLGLGGALTVLLAMVVVYIKTNRPRGYQSI